MCRWVVQSEGSSTVADTMSRKSHNRKVDKCCCKKYLLLKNYENGMDH